MTHEIFPSPPHVQHDATYPLICRKLLGGFHGSSAFASTGAAPTDARPVFGAERQTKRRPSSSVVRRPIRRMSTATDRTRSLPSFGPLGIRAAHAPKTFLADVSARVESEKTLGSTPTTAWYCACGAGASTGTSCPEVVVAAGLLVASRMSHTTRATAA